MKTTMELINERTALWEQTKALLDRSRDPVTGMVPADEVAKFERMTAQIKQIGNEINLREKQAEMDRLIYGDKAPASPAPSSAPIEVIADARGEANPSVDGANEDALRLIDCLAIHAHKHDDDTQVVMAYDSGVGEGYIGFSESMRLLKNRAGKTRIKSISFSDQPDTTRMYVDAVAVTVNAEEQRYEKSLELMNVMAEADVLTKLSVRDSAPQYLFLARRIPYLKLSKLFPLYSQMEELAGEGNNRAILTP